MDIDLETIAKKVDILESKVSELEKIHMHIVTEADTERIMESVKRYLKSSSEIRNIWKGRLSAVEEVRVMRKHSRGY